MSSYRVFLAKLFFAFFIVCAISVILLGFFSHDVSILISTKVKWFMYLSIGSLSTTIMLLTQRQSLFLWIGFLVTLIFCGIVGDPFAGWLEVAAYWIPGVYAMAIYKVTEQRKKNMTPNKSLR